MANCNQCDTPEFVHYASGWLCIRHFLMLKQAEWFQFAQLAAWHNNIQESISRGTGYITGPPNLIKIPQPPTIGEGLTLNNIQISHSTVGLINTGTIKRVEHLDASVTTFSQTGKEELSQALREFVQLLVDSDISPDLREEIAQQLEFLTAEVQADPIQQRPAICKSLLDGVQRTIEKIPVLVEAWTSLQGLLEKHLGG